ncbi:hypothetical protein [Nocardia brasiliensis]|uniref:hypothetical protein n=1 Tax=Nocardia brasiliensis TaxID=37326 RepID=UPI0024574494|nr:hypothetical protein [Nocardia brasiliensis]
MYVNDIPDTDTVTDAELSIARGYLITCVQYWKDEADAENFSALPAEQVIDRVLRLWPEGWADFCAHFADDIHAAEEAERAERAARWREVDEKAARWHAEVERVARRHLFGTRLPAAVSGLGCISLTASEAVRAVGARIAADHTQGMSWREVAARSSVPVPVAFTWAIEARARQRLALLGGALRRAFRTSVFR